jgi:crossover junction endodeoxyribonuclease RuvC
MIKVLGIDPGLSATGVGIVRGRVNRIAGYSFGCITTAKTATLPERLEKIFSRISALVTAEKPDLVVVEDVFSLKEYPKSGIALGQVSGVVLLALSQAGPAWMELPVREAKHVLTGNGNAGKNQLEAAVRRRLDHPEPIRPYHASDALGLAIIGLLRYDNRLRGGSPRGAGGDVKRPSRGRVPAAKPPAGIGRVRP